MSSRRTISWSELPPEFLTLIVDRLGTRSDTDNFQLVCNKWQVAASYSNHRPQNLLSPICPDKLSFPNHAYSGHFNSVPLCFITLSPISVFLVRSLVDAKRTPWLLTVEELNPGKLSQCQPLSQDTARFLQSSLLKKFKFNPSYFSVSEIGRSYRLRCVGASSICNQFSKVVLIVNPNCPMLPTIKDYDVIGLTFDGSLELISLKHRTVRKIKSSKIKVYDDVVNFKGSVFTIDRKGRAYILEHKDGTLRDVVLVPVGEGLGSDMKKRLAETSTGELFLIHRCPTYLKAVFKIYKLDEERNLWDEVEGIGDDRILFVDSGGCFFAKTKDLPGWRGNCMVFRRGEFRAYNSQSSADSEFFGKKRSIRGDLAIVVFHFDTGDWEHVVCHPQYSDLFAVQPAWLESDAQLFNIMSAAEKQIARDLYSRVASEPTSEAGMPVAGAMLAVNNQEGTKEGESPNPMPNIRGPRIIDMESFPAIQVMENGISRVTFRGVNVCPALVPILQKIWDMYGNLIEGNVMKSEGLLTWAFESLAKMVMILQINSPESLSESQVAYLKTTLGDLQLLPITLDWLIPFVRRALQG